MQRCKTCRHWKKPDSNSGYGEIPGSGNCQAVIQFWDATEWTEDGHGGRSLKPQHKGKLAFVQDGSDYMAILKTLPDFGCVSHEPMAE